MRVGQAVLRMTLRELKAELRHRHMKVGGLKLQLQLRLQATIDGASPTNTNTPAPNKMSRTAVIGPMARRYDRAESLNARLCELCALSDSCFSCRAFLGGWGGPSVSRSLPARQGRGIRCQWQAGATMLDPINAIARTRQYSRVTTACAERPSVAGRQASRRASARPPEARPLLSRA